MSPDAPGVYGEFWYFQEGAIFDAMHGAQLTKYAGYGQERTRGCGVKRIGFFSLGSADHNVGEIAIVRGVE